MILLCLLYCVVLSSNINCVRLNATANSTSENILKSERVNGSAQEKHLPDESKMTIVKKRPGCVANDCKQQHGQTITDETTTKRFIKRVKYLKTPPESLNFLVTVPSLGKKQDKRPEQISIYHLNEKGDSRDWPVEYDFEVVQPDYKFDEPLFANTEKSYPDDISIEIDDGEDEDVNEDDSENEEENDLENVLDPQPKQSSVERKMHLTSTFPMDLSNKRYQFKHQEVGKPYVKKSTRKPSKNDRIPIINRSYKFNENSSHPVIKANRKTGHFFYGFTPDPDNEFRFVPFPVYFSAKPMRHRDRLVVPYPYFVLRTNKSDTENVDVELSDLNKTEIWIEGLSIPGEKGFDFLPNVELDFTDDYARLENDEDYIPSTEEDKNEPFYVDSTTVGISSESSESSTEFRRPSNWFRPTRIPFTIVIENISTKYPDPYQNGSIYVWYDCLDMVNGTEISQSVSMFPLLFLLLFHLLEA